MLFNAEVIDGLNDAAFGLLNKEVAWSKDKLATCVEERLLTVATGILVHALDVTEPMLSVEMVAMSAGVIPAIKLNLNEMYLYLFFL